MITIDSVLSKGVLKATDIARCYIEEGKEFAVDNLYLHALDEYIYMEEKGYCWVRMM